MLNDQFIPNPHPFLISATDVQAFLLDMQFGNDWRMQTNHFNMLQLKVILTKLVIGEI